MSGYFRVQSNYKTGYKEGPISLPNALNLSLFSLPLLRKTFLINLPASSGTRHNFGVMAVAKETRLRILVYGILACNVQRFRVDQLHRRLLRVSLECYRPMSFSLSPASMREMPRGTPPTILLSPDHSVSTSSSSPTSPLNFHLPAMGHY